MEHAASHSTSCNYRKSSCATHSYHCMLSFHRDNFRFFFLDFFILLLSLFFYSRSQFDIHVVFCLFFFISFWCSFTSTHNIDCHVNAFLIEIRLFSGFFLSILSALWSEFRFVMFRRQRKKNVQNWFRGKESWLFLKETFEDICVSFTLGHGYFFSLQFCLSFVDRQMRKFVRSRRKLNNNILNVSIIAREKREKKSKRKKRERKWKTRNNA